MKFPVFMDHHSTTPVDPRVLNTMLPYFSEIYGNAASKSHAFGWQAEEACEHARKQIATAIGAEPSEIIFTSGATEANNLAIQGTALALQHKGNHIITQVTEHKAVLDVCKMLEQRGFKLTYLPVDRLGFVDPKDVQKNISDKTILVSIMHTNNEIGSEQPLQEIGKICKQHGVWFHSDAAQSKQTLNVQNFDLLALSAHKIYGPKGMGALFVRRKNPRVTLQPILWGGGHERGLRAGTLNVPAIVGFGEAVAIAENGREYENKELIKLKNHLQHQLFTELDDIYLNGPSENRHPGNLNIAFGKVKGETLLLALRDVAVSSGSACTSATMQPSHVLKAIGVSDALSHSSLRFGLGRYTTLEEVDFVASYVIEQVKKLRARFS